MAEDPVLRTMLFDFYGELLTDKQREYFDLHYKDFAFKQDHNLSVSGGSDKVRYYVSGGAYTEEGILRYADIDYARYNIAANINADLTKWMRLKFNTKYSHQETNTPFGTGGLSEGF